MAEVEKLNLVGMGHAELAQLLAFDVPRTWATSVQAFSNPESMLFVFREVLNATAEPADPSEVQSPTVIQRNVASIILPLNVAKEFSQVLQQMFPNDAQI